MIPCGTTKGESMKALGALAAVTAALALTAPAAFADPPSSPSCWGAATSAFAQSAPGALGEHASSPPPIDLTPDRPGRAGIGNVARILGGDHPSDAAAALGFTCS
jgi:hypothetical protein